jgi:ubiquinone/menaquinone biosynthesis C-methylase UbiE
VKEFADHFAARAAAYAAYRPRYPDALFARLAELAPSRRLAWDCGAGSGQATLGLANWFERVVATDASPAQLAGAARHPRAEYRLARAEASGLDDRSADLIAVAQALHWFDVEAFYAEARRVLAPRGVVAVWCYGLLSVDGGPIDHRLEHYYAGEVGPYWAFERRLVETGYRTLPFPFEELPPPAVEMSAAWTLDELLGYVRSWSATQRCFEAEDRDPVAALEADLAPVWGEPSRRRTITWPFSIRVGRGE